MKRGLLIVGKDVDAFLASHINQNEMFGLKLDIVVLKHRDLLEFSERFPAIDVIHSLPRFLRDNSPPLEAETDSSLFRALHSLEEKFKLRSSNRYIHYDFFRARPRDMTLRQHVIRNILFVRFFESIGLGQYDFILGELSRSFNLICSDMAKSVGVEYLSIVNIGITRAVAFVDDRFQLRGLEKKKARLLADPAALEEYRAKARALIDEFRNRPRYTHSFLINHSFQAGSVVKRLLGKGKAILLELRALPIDRKFRVDYIYQNPVVRIWSRHVTAKFKAKIFQWVFFKRGFDSSGDFVYFPLHAHPETTTSLFSEFMVDHTSQQASSVEFVSKALPAGMKLVVKEHPYMLGVREARHYPEFHRWYNVDFVRPGLSQFELIQKCRLVLTLCGTVGLEALFFSKPVIALTDSYYGYFRQIRNIRSFPDLESEIPALISSFKLDETGLVEDLALLLYSIHTGAIYFLIDDDARVIGKENLDLLASSIVDELSL